METQEYNKLMIKVVQEEEPVDIINPEIPKDAMGRLLLYHRALGAVAAGKLVRGVTPAHVKEGMYTLQREIDAQQKRWASEDSTL